MKNQVVWRGQKTRFVVQVVTEKKIQGRGKDSQPEREKMCKQRMQQENIIEEREQECFVDL